MITHFNMQKFIIKLNVYLILNPLIKLFIEVILLFILSTIFQIDGIIIITTFIVEENQNVILKKLILEQLLENFNKEESKAFFGTLNTRLGHAFYPLITQFYHDKIRSSDYIMKYLETIDWNNYIENYDNNINAILDHISKNYTKYFMREETLHYTTLISAEQFEKYKASIIHELLQYSNTNRYFSPYVSIIDSCISKYIETIDIPRYLKSWDFNSGNLQVLNNAYLQYMHDNWIKNNTERTLFSLNEILKNISLSQEIATIKICLIILTTISLIAKITEIPDLTVTVYVEDHIITPEAAKLIEKELPTGFTIIKRVIKTLVKLIISSFLDDSI
jgi:hypothetical protein